MTGLKTRENARTRGKGHRHAYTLTVRVWRQRCAHTIDRTCTCTHTCGGSPKCTCRSQQKCTEKWATESHVNTFSSFSFKVCVCVCVCVCVSGPTNVCVCVTETALILGSVEAKVQPPFPQQQHSSLLQYLPFLHFPASGNPLFTSQSFTFFFWSRFPPPLLLFPVPSSAVPTHLFLVFYMFCCFLSPHPRHSSSTVEWQNSCFTACGSKTWRSHLLLSSAQHRSPPGLCAQPPPVHAVHPQLQSRYGESFVVMFVKSCRHIKAAWSGLRGIVGYNKVIFELLTGLCVMVYNMSFGKYNLTK